MMVNQQQAEDEEGDIERDSQWWRKKGQCEMDTYRWRQKGMTVGCVVNEGLWKKLGAKGRSACDCIAAITSVLHPSAHKMRDGEIISSTDGYAGMRQFHST